MWPGGAPSAQRECCQSGEPAKASWGGQAFAAQPRASTNTHSAEGASTRMPLRSDARFHVFSPKRGFSPPLSVTFVLPTWRAIRRTQRGPRGGSRATPRGRDRVPCGCRSRLHRDSRDTSTVFGPTGSATYSHSRRKATRPSRSGYFLTRIFIRRPHAGGVSAVGPANRTLVEGLPGARSRDRRGRNRSAKPLDRGLFAPFILLLAGYLVRKSAHSGTRPRPRVRSLVAPRRTAFVFASIRPRAAPLSFLCRDSLAEGSPPSLSTVRS